MILALSPAVPSEATGRVRRLAENGGWDPSVLDAEEFGPAPAPEQPMDMVIVKPAPPPRWRLTRGQVLIGAKLGGTFAEAFSGLGASFLLGGWL